MILRGTTPHALTWGGLLAVLGVAAALLPWLPTWAQEDPINASNYNSFQGKYNKRYSHGLTALISYTYGKSLDYGGSAASGGGSAGNPQTVTNLRAGYGASGFDQKHRLVGSATFELPFGGGRKFLNQGFASHIVGGEIERG